MWERCGEEENDKVVRCWIEPDEGFSLTLSIEEDGEIYAEYSPIEEEWHPPIDTLKTSSYKKLSDFISRYTDGEITLTDEDIQDIEDSRREYLEKIRER